MRNDPLRRHGWSSSIISLEMTLVDGSTTAGDLGFSSAKSEMVSAYYYSFHDTKTNPQQNETRNGELKSNRNRYGEIGTVTSVGRVRQTGRVRTLRGVRAGVIRIAIAFARFGDIGQELQSRSFMRRRMQRVFSLVHGYRKCCIRNNTPAPTVHVLGVIVAARR